MDPDIKKEIVDKFNSLFWHDSKLRFIEFRRLGREEQIHLSLELQNESGGFDARTLVFLRCNRIKMDIDLESKRDCSDDIFDARCYVSSGWKTSVAEGDPYNNYQNYLHFWIELCPRSGSLDILAEDFELVKVETPPEQSV